MTDELELLKQDWQKKEFDVPKLSYDAIHKMIWKKSSSMVKWILIVSILEFTLPHLLFLLPGTVEAMSVYERIGISRFFYGLSIFYYAIVLFFIYQFYLRFKEISVLDNSKNLMRNILKTRKMVKYYVVFSLATAVLSVLIMVMGIYLSDDIINAFPTMSDTLKEVSPAKLKLSLMMAMGIFGVIFVALLALFYFLLYGLLLRTLKKNYKELKNLEL